MNRNILFGALILVILGAGCTRQPMPVPYPQPTEPAEPMETTIQISSPRFDEDASPLKQGPPPLADPDLSEGVDDLSQTDPKYKPLSAGFVNDRIRFYQEKLERWKQADQQAAITSLDAEQTRLMVDCFRDLQTVLGGYQNVHSQIFEQGGSAGSLNLEYMIGLQRQDIAFLESRCAQLLATTEEQGTGLFAGPEGDFSSIEQRIIELHEAGAHDQVVQAWSDLPSYQKDGVNRKTALAYADALIYLNDPAGAAEAYEQVVDALASRTDSQEDLLSLRQRLGDLYAAAGNFFAAETQYEILMKEYAQVGRIENWAKLQLSMLERSMKGSPELTDYSELLRGYLGFVPSRDGYSVVYKAEQFLQQYPYSPVSPNVDIIKDETSAVADQWFFGKISEAEMLVETKKFDEAIALLQSIPQDKLSPENLLQLKEKLDSLVLAEAVERETVKIEKMQALQSSWNEGSSFAESGDYDAAIAVFSELKGTEYNDRAQKRIDELSLTAAKIERRRAADLFVRSMKTDDLQNRKELLIESRQVLKDILRKYPDVEVAEKVEGNVRTVEKKMNELDPMLLPELVEKEKQLELLQEPEFDGFDTEPADPFAAPQEVPPRQTLPVLPPQS